MLQEEIFICDACVKQGIDWHNKRSVNYRNYGKVKNKYELVPCLHPNQCLVELKEFSELFQLFSFLHLEYTDRV